MSGGEAVFEAVGAAGIFCDVAADGADRLRGRVGSVEIILRGDAVADVEIDYAGFDDGVGVGEIDFEDFVHAGEADDDAFRSRQRAAGESCASASGDERDAMPGTDANDGLNLVPGARQDNGGR